jgi:hypothetical protein
MKGSSYDMGTPYNYRQTIRDYSGEEAAP